MLRRDRKRPTDRRTSEGIPERGGRAEQPKTLRNIALAVTSFFVRAKVLACLVVVSILGGSTSGGGLLSEMLRLKSYSLPPSTLEKGNRQEGLAKQPATQTRNTETGRATTKRDSYITRRRETQ